MTGRSLSAWLERLETLHPSNIELGLERVGSVAQALKCHQFDCPVVTVAGTNGKGSSCAVLEAMAKNSGKRVGVFSSPHLMRYNERVRINGLQVDDHDLVEVFELIDSARGTTKLTYFEFGALAALQLFQQAELDLVILEVGLGGRLDAVNIVDADIAVITSIALDHEDWLGSTRETIAVEKAGILRRGITAVVADLDPPQSLLKAVDDMGCRLLSVIDADVPQWVPDRVRAENYQAAWLVARELGFAPSLQSMQGLEEALVLPGRLQRMELGKKVLLLDVAHNQAAVENLVFYLNRGGHIRARALFAALSDKDIHAMIRSCSGVFEEWHVCDLPNVPRALNAREIASVLTEQGERVSSTSGDPATALHRAIEGDGAGPLVVVFGSFFTVAGVLEELEQGQAALGDQSA